jgi:hypothetical protein
VSAMSITLILIVSMTVVVYLAVRSGEKYGHQDAHVHSEEYAGIIREGHGPLTVFLIVSFTATFLWTAIYFGTHAGEFSTGGNDTAQVERPAGMN